MFLNSVDGEAFSKKSQICISKRLVITSAFLLFSCKNIFRTGWKYLLISYSVSD